MLDYLHSGAAANPWRPAEEDEDEHKGQICSQSNICCCEGLGTKDILSFNKGNLSYFCVFVSGVRAEEALRGRVPPEDGGAL